MSTDRPLFYKGLCHASAGESVLVEATTFGSQRIVALRVRERPHPKAKRETRVTFSLPQARAALRALTDAIAAAEASDA